MSLGDSATPLGKVRGTGSAHEGGQHWLQERVGSVALFLLGLWLVASLLLLPSFDRRTVGEWLSHPGGAVPMALFVVASFAHAADGLKVVIDDYVHDSVNHLFLSILLAFASIGGAGIALFCLARIAFGAA